MLNDFLCAITGNLQVYKADTTRAYRKYNPYKSIQQTSVLLIILKSQYMYINIMTLQKYPANFNGCKMVFDMTAMLAPNLP